mmetsp:Transcript_13472/g.36199  ORF Transcript_13472/g.36199 Transcript_13472/m.36199 type:complete len:259 (+) Transcript_13472:1393-2169(+)
MVVTKHTIEQVDDFRRDQVFILRIDKLVPVLAAMRAYRTFQSSIKDKTVLVQVLVQICGAKHSRNFHQLVLIVGAAEEWFALENHSRQHTSEAPDVERVVVILQIDEQLGSFEVARSNAHVVLFVRMVKLGQTPINNSDFSLRVVNHDVVRLDISMHDAVRMRVIERAQDLIDVVANLVNIQCRIQHFEVGVVHVFKHEARDFRLRIAADVKKLDGVHAAAQITQNFDLATNFLFLHGLQHLDDAFLIGLCVEPFKHV